MATSSSLPKGQAVRAAATLVSTPMGWVCAVIQAGRAVATSLPRPTRGAAMAVCPSGCDFASDEESLAMLASDIRRYFAGEPVDLTRHPVDLSERPPFSQRALAVTRRIPYGRVRTYAWVATQAGKPGAARAVGQVMRRNPLPLLIPCHRVVGARGELTGFGGGLPLKRALLMLEGLTCQGDRVVLD